MKNQTLKECTNCHQTFPLDRDNFYIRRDTDFTSWCKKCLNQHTTERGQKRKLKAVEYKGGKCVICNYHTHPNAFDFHHLDPSKKEQSPSSMRLLTWESQMKELDKCILVCRNCHAEIHAGLHPQYLIVKEQNQLVPPTGLEPV
jgi:hypothetical protein